MTDPKYHAELWDAINEYAAVCGGDTSAATVSDRRMDAVAAVGRELEAELTAAADRIAELEAEIREWESMCLDSEGFPRGGDYILKWMRSWCGHRDALKGAAK